MDTHASINHPKPIQSTDLVLLSFEVLCSTPFIFPDGSLEFEARMYDSEINAMYYVYDVGAKLLEWYFPHGPSCMYILNSSFTVLVENSQEVLYESEGVITFTCEVLQ